MDSSTPSQRFKSAILVISTLLIIYVMGYGVMRWRKVLVRHEFYAWNNIGKGADRTLSEYPSKEQVFGSMIHEIRAGQDLRHFGVGAFKNSIAEPVAILYTPMRWLEAAFWTFRTSAPTHSSPPTSMGEPISKSNGLPTADDHDDPFAKAEVEEGANKP